MTFIRAFTIILFLDTKEATILPSAPFSAKTSGIYNWPTEADIQHAALNSSPVVLRKRGTIEMNATIEIVQTFLLNSERRDCFERSNNIALLYFNRHFTRNKKNKKIVYRNIEGINFSIKTMNFSTIIYM